jgi:hypothetical protein
VGQNPGWEGDLVSVLPGNRQPTIGRVKMPPPSIIVRVASLDKDDVPGRDTEHLSVLTNPLVLTNSPGIEQGTAGRGFSGRSRGFHCKRQSSFPQSSFRKRRSPSPSRANCLVSNITLKLCAPALCPPCRTYSKEPIQRTPRRTREAFRTL